MIALLSFDDSRAHILIGCPARDLVREEEAVMHTDFEQMDREVRQEMVRCECGAIKCYKCGREFVPDRAKLDAWANSGRPFDPTDWECEYCSQMETFGTYEAPESEDEVDPNLMKDDPYYSSGEFSEDCRDQDDCMQMRYS